MASIYDLKPRFQNLLRPLLAKLVRFGITPNNITWLALLGSLSVGCVIWLWGNHPVCLLLLAAWLLARMSLNALDGMMAREFQMTTSHGAMLNELGDVLSDLALYLPLAGWYAPATWPVIAFVFGAILTELCGVFEQALGGQRRYDGPMGKSDRAAMIGVLSLLTLVWPLITCIWPWVFTLAVVLTAVTCRNRLSHAFNQTQPEEDMNPGISFDNLKQPLPTYSLKNAYYALARAFLKTAGNLSDGIRLGNKFGFDSGVMLDYVYKNQAAGKFLVGKLIDRIYLNAVGWKGIRLRKALITESLKKVAAEQLQRKMRIRYLDLACGGGEYDIAVLKNFPSARVEAELRDYKQENIAQARDNAERCQLNHIRFKQLDAFDPDNYQEKWDVIVASGFWEIIDDDRLVKACMLNAARCLDPGSVLVFTIQPHHPQLEFIARTLTSHTGKPWVMRLRSLELYRAWMKEANLQYVSHRMEKHGIFGVVEAIKI
jgi:phosphatidylglycerophosphate synthase/SAM-dependent methyltransferase